MKINSLSFLRAAAAAAFLVCGFLTASAAAQDHPAVKRKFDWPPSADLHYSIKANQSGLSLDGNALLKWNITSNAYSVAMETRAMLFGKIIESKSEGGIDEYGLAPINFTDKRRRKEPNTTSFNRDSNIISFAQSSETYPIKGGEQDRSSVIWQLIAIARGAPDKFKPGSEWSFFVAGQRDAEAWSFKVIDHEKIQSTLGDINAVHIVRTPPPDAKSQQLDIWLAPSLEWYPLRLRFTDPDGNTVEQTLENIHKK